MHDPPVPESMRSGQPNLQLCTALLPSNLPAELHHGPVAHIDELLGLHGDRLPDAEGVVKPLTDSLVPLVAFGVGRVHVLDHDLGIEEGKESVKLATLQGLEVGVDQLVSLLEPLHVLLRHRPRSISQATRKSWQEANPGGRIPLDANTERGGTDETSRSAGGSC